MSSDFDSLEEFDNLDDDIQAADAMDEIVEDEIVDDISEDTGASAETSQEAETVQEAETTPATRSNRLSFVKSMTIYDGMLVASALCVSLACVLLVLELTSFGGLFFQWRTTEAIVEPLTP